MARQIHQHIQLGCGQQFFLFPERAVRQFDELVTVPVYTLSDGISAGIQLQTHHSELTPVELGQNALYEVHHGVVAEVWRKKPDPDATPRGFVQARMLRPCRHLRLFSHFCKSHGSCMNVLCSHLWQRQHEQQLVRVRGQFVGFDGNGRFAVLNRLSDFAQLSSVDGPLYIRGALFNGCFSQFKAAGCNFNPARMLLYPIQPLGQLQMDQECVGLVLKYLFNEVDGVVAHVHQGLRLVEHDFGIVWPKHQTLVERLNGFLFPVRLVQRKPQIAVTPLVGPVFPEQPFAHPDQLLPIVGLECSLQFGFGRTFCWGVA